MTFTLGFLYSSSGEKKLVKNAFVMLYSLCTALSIPTHYNFRDCHVHFYAFYRTTFIEKAVSIYPRSIPCHYNVAHSKFARATKRTPEWVIYNMKGYLNPRWCLVTIDLR